MRAKACSSSSRTSSAARLASCCAAFIWHASVVNSSSQFPPARLRTDAARLASSCAPESPAGLKERSTDASIFLNAATGWAAAAMLERGRFIERSMPRSKLADAAGAVALSLEAWAVEKERTWKMAFGSAQAASGRPATSPFLNRPNLPKRTPHLPQQSKRPRMFFFRSANATRQRQRGTGRRLGLGEGAHRAGDGGAEHLLI
ncbi:hypothetical protein T484DRAFT_1935034, partial [Baffinella frigidus]